MYHLWSSSLLHHHIAAMSLLSPLLCHHCHSHRVIAIALLSLHCHCHCHRVVTLLSSSSLCCCCCCCCCCRVVVVAFISPFWCTWGFWTASAGGPSSIAWDAAAIVGERR